MIDGFIGLLAYGLYCISVILLLFVFNRSFSRVLIRIFAQIMEIVSVLLIDVSVGY